MRYSCLSALLLSTVTLACGVEGIEVRDHGAVLDVLHTARYAQAPWGRDIEFEATGDALRLRGTVLGQQVDAHPQIRLKITKVDGSPCWLASAGPRLGDGIWETDEGIQIGIEDGSGLEIEGQLTWSGPIPFTDPSTINSTQGWSH
jgi:hypothetical protein